MFMLASFLMGLTTAGTLYVSAYLKEIGLSSAQVGLFTSLRSIIGIFAPLCWGIACDKLKTVKRPFIGCLLFTIILFPLIPISEKWYQFSFALAPWMTVFVRFFYRPLDTIMSTWIAQIRRDDPQMDYGKTRVFSSIGSTIASAIYSSLIAIFSVRVGFYGVGILGFLVLLLVPKLPDVIPEDKKRTSFKDMHLDQIIRNPRLVLFYFLVIFSSIPFATSTNFMAYLLDEIGTGNEILGMVSTIRSLCQIPLMFYSEKVFKKFPYLPVLLVTSLILGSGEFIYGGVQSAGMILLVSVVVNTSNGLRNAAQVLYADYLAPKELKSTVVMLSSTMLAITTIIASSMAGTMIDTVGIRAFYLVSGILSVSSVVIFAIATKYLDHKEAQK